MVRYSRSRLPSRYWMEWNTGDACGLTLTRSWAFREAKSRAVIAVTSEALEAWWPPTLTPSPVVRSWLAASTIRTASHSTRRWISSSTSRSTAVLAVTAAVSGRASSLMPLAPDRARVVHGAARPARDPGRDRREAPHRADGKRRHQRGQGRERADRRDRARGPHGQERTRRADPPERT